MKPATEKDLQMDIIIAARPGHIAPRTRLLVGQSVTGLSSASTARFERGCDEGDLFVADFDPATDTISTDVLGETVTVQKLGASRSELCDLIFVAAQEAL